MRLSEPAREIVREAIVKTAGELGEVAVALAVCETHVHLVVRRGGRRTIAEVVAICKTKARQALGECGYAGKVWGKGFDKQFCYSEEAMAARVAYVERHGAGEV